MNNIEQLTKETKKSRDKITARLVLNELRKANYGFSTQLVWFVLLTIVSLIIAYIFPYSLILTLPLILIPSYFAFSSVNAIKGTKNSEGVGFFTLFKSYFSQIFFGGYRILLGFLKGFGAYLLSSGVMIFILDLTVFKNNAEYKAITEKVASNQNINELTNEMTDFIKKNSDIAKYILLVTAIGFVIGAIIFINHILKHSIKMRRNLFTKQLMPIRQFNFVDKRLRKNNRKELVSIYFRTTWFIQLALLLAVAGGIVLSFFFLNDFDDLQTLVISIFLMFVVSIPFLNYITKLQDLIYIRFAKEYESTFASLTLEFLNKYKDKIGIAEEDAKKIEELLQEHKKANLDNQEEDSKKDEK